VNTLISLDLNFSNRILGTLSVPALGSYCQYFQNETLLYQRLNEAEVGLSDAVQLIPSVPSLGLSQSVSIIYGYASGYPSNDNCMGTTKALSCMLFGPVMDGQHRYFAGAARFEEHLESLDRPAFFSALQAIQVTRFKERIELIRICLRLVAVVKQAINALRSAASSRNVVQQQEAWYLTHGAHPPKEEGLGIRTAWPLREGVHHASSLLQAFPN